ncbi:carboxylate--amine ligase, partial [Rhodococcus oxybenzonivorans]|nr:carboxylate--amine ligase [Rhodococcus oxybenzonivorans]
MSEHVLVVGSGRDLPSRVRSALPGTQTSVICRLDFVAKLRQLTEHARVIAVRHDAPDEEWIALARAAHARHPFTRIATFGERDQDRCAAIGEALG